MQFFVCFHWDGECLLSHLTVTWMEDLLSPFWCWYNPWEFLLIPYLNFIHHLTIFEFVARLFVFLPTRNMNLKTAFEAITSLDGIKMTKRNNTSKSKNKRSIMASFDMRALLTLRVGGAGSNETRHLNATSLFLSSQKQTFNNIH